MSTFSRGLNTMKNPMKPAFSHGFPEGSLVSLTAWLARQLTAGTWCTPWRPSGCHGHGRHRGSCFLRGFRQEEVGNSPVTWWKSLDVIDWNDNDILASLKIPAWSIFRTPHPIWCTYHQRMNENTGYTQWSWRWVFRISGFNSGCRVLGFRSLGF